MCRLGIVLTIALTTNALFGSELAVDHPTLADWIDEAKAGLENELVSQYGGGQRARLRRGMDQVADLWRDEDGDRSTFEHFVRANFAGDQETLDTMFERSEFLFEQFNGHMLEIILALRRQSDLNLGPILPFDQVMAGYDPSAHATDDLFANKIAFTVLLNFPLTTLEQRLNDGQSWTRRQWAEARMAQQFARRVPAEVQLELSRASAQADRYIAEYNIWMHHLLDDEGQRLFPAKMKLLSHWNLRDQIKADYSDGENALAKQRMIQKVMERIVTQTIPEVVVNNPHVDWNPYINEVWSAAVQDSDSSPPPDLDVSNDREPDTRYETLLATYQAARLVDPYAPTAPTLIARRFDENREIPEERVEAMFEQILSSLLLAEVGKLIEERLGRPLEPGQCCRNIRGRRSYRRPSRFSPRHR